MSTPLVKYEAARTALAAAHRVDEVKSIRDKAQALAAYAKQARDTQMVQWATEIKVRAERRAGEMLAQAKERGEVREGRPGKLSAGSTVSSLPKLGITRDQSSRWQRLADMPEEHFETAVETAKATAGAVTSAHMLRLAEELRANRDLEEQLEEARNNLDRASRADAAWRPVRVALTSLHARIQEAKRLPRCPQKTRAEMAELWATVSRFLSNHLEQK
jgi:hypothetical protein